jgi:L-alanine-DL-glutamate epimerase-like enolase superfamily enzyme
MNWASTRESGADFMILRLTTSEGLVGVSEGVVKTAWTGATLRSLAVCFEEIFTRMLIGLDPEDVGGTKKISRIRENNLAKAMIDVALWDLRSQLSRRPLWRIQMLRPQAVQQTWLFHRRPQVRAQTAALF